ncbi:MAG: helix-turn-helix domain-containing protein [Victivallaceae bacterium]|nr:helix-turn-helix domain-containing protein [Victivallaceae bacterium]
MNGSGLSFPLADEEARLLVETENWSLYDQFSSGPFMEGQSPVPARMESHPFREILFALRGDYDFAFLDRRVRCVPGTVIFIDNDLSHEFLYRKPEKELLHLWIHLHSKEHLIIRLLHLDREGKASVHPLCSLPQMQGELWNYWDRLSQCRDEAMRAIVRRYLKYTLALIFDAAQHMAVAQTQAQVAVEYAMTLLGRFCGMSIDALAAQTGYSRFHFSRLFRKQYGMSPEKYRQMRCWNRYLEMRSRHMPNKEIASELGFANVSAFYRWVKTARNRYVGKAGNASDKYDLPLS